MTQIDVSIIVVSYNTRDLTLDLLRSVHAETREVQFEVIVIDNASADGSPAAISRQFPEVRLMSMNENLGFAAGNNLAAETARGKYLLLLNPDTVVLRGAVQKLLAFAQSHPEAGIYGGRTLWGDRSLNPTSCWRRPTPWSMFCWGSGLSSVFRGNRFLDSESYGPWKRDTVRRVDIVTGCLLLIRKDLWDRLGGFDPEFFQRGEEADLCLRARKMGARPVLCPDAEIIHYGGASEKVRSEKIIRNLRAKRLLFERHWPSLWVPFGKVMLFAWILRCYVAWSLIKVLGKPNSIQQSDTYREILLRRKEWLQ